MGGGRRGRWVGLCRHKPWGSPGRVGLCSGSSGSPRRLLSRLGPFWLSQARAGWGIGPGGDSPSDGVTAQPGPPQALASAGGTLVMWEGAPAPLTSPFFLAGPGGHAQRYVFGKGQAGPRRPLLARCGMAGRGG